MNVKGYINGQPVEFDARASNQYAAETDRSSAGYKSEIIAQDEYGNVSMAYETSYTGDEWIDPIWWRAPNDVQRAQYLNGKIASVGLRSLSPAEQREWLSGLLGCLNYYDLNRIEIDTRWLYIKLYAAGYGFGERGHKVDWIMTDIPWAAELERIRSNIQGLIDIYHAQDAQLPGSLASPDWQQINAVERILYEMYEMIRRMEQSYQYCGVPACGQEVVL